MMDNQFCNRCGQANLPGAALCTKCGQTLGAGAAKPAGQQPNQQNFSPQNQTPVTSKKSNKKFWIIGAIAAVLIISVGVIILAAAAAGILIYTTPNEEIAANKDNDVKITDDPKNDSDPKDESDSKSDSDDPLGDIKFPSSDDVDFGGGSDSSTSDSELIKLFKEKKARVGIFSLKSASELKNDGTFPGRISGAIATYTGGSADLTHEIYLYASADDAAKDFATFRQVLKKLKVKFRTNNASQVIFEKDSKVFLGFRNKQGGIHVFGSDDGNDILKYYNAFFS